MGKLFPIYGHEFSEAYERGFNQTNLEGLAILKFLVLSLLFPAVIFAAIIGMIAIAISMEFGVFQKREKACAALIHKAPGYRLTKILCIFLTKKYSERVMEQSLSDLQVDYAEALSKNDLWEARKHVIGFYLKVTLVFALAAFASNHAQLDRLR